ncbi:hypothetical protein PsorP6_016376 [Peronosclerospora sorghi]|uniref:Uncharacterized protein n=1 Tax=Peronosclerospora sorghi TaxID=230839 RepID=A0ACC0VT71_9STRA|nr:hypothetical protein PsorP6_016376 [Peronosclerospora sorghi]
MNNAVRNGVKVEADQPNYMHQVLSKSPQDPNTKRVESSAMKQQDEVAKEMLGWVSVYRDPEVIRRKESIRCKRKHTKRFSVTSDEQQRQALLQLKSIDGTNSCSDSDKGDSISSDYSPMEDEDSEKDEIEVVSLLSDESDEERVRVKRKRVRRNRAGESTFKRKKTRLRKPAGEHKSVTRTSSHHITQDADITLKVEPPGDVAKSSVMNTPATTKSASIIASPGSSSNQEIEHLSGPSKVKREINSTSVDDNASPGLAVYDTTMKSTIATSPTCVNSVQRCLQKELYPNEVRDLQSELTKPASNDGKDDSDDIFGETVFQSTAVKCADNAPKNTLCTHPANTSDNAGVATNVSDMGTVESKLTSTIERK